MDIGSEMLARYMEFLASTETWSDSGFSNRMQVCMILDNIAGEMMDEAQDPSHQQKIFAVYDKIKRRTLDAESKESSAGGDSRGPCFESTDIFASP